MDILEQLQNADAFMQLTVLAVAALIITQAIKIGLTRYGYEDRPWFSMAIIAIAFGASIAVSLLARLANVVAVDAPQAALIILQSVFIGVFATGSYEWISKLWDFITGIFALIRTGDTTIIGGDVSDSTVAVGRDAESESN